MNEILILLVTLLFLTYILLLGVYALSMFDPTTIQEIDSYRESRQNEGLCTEEVERLDETFENECS